MDKEDTVAANAGIMDSNGDGDDADDAGLVYGSLSVRRTATAFLHRVA